MLYRITQGETYPIRVYSQNSILILKDQTTIMTFNTVVSDEEGNLWLNVLIDQNNFISAGTKQYQLFENNQLKESGNIIVIASLLVDPNQDLRNRYQVIVEAIEKMLAGTASRAQRQVKVGDMQIQYMSTSQLMSLLDYFKVKAKEEDTVGNSVNPTTDQLKIKYVWRWK